MSSPSASFVPAPGAAPLPDYELKALLGRGGFGEVWRATGPGGFDVAIKFVRLEGKAGDVERRALETIKGLRHAHLLPVFGAWERDGFWIMAMELGDKSLMDRFEECHAAKQRGLPREELLGYLRDAARGLDYLAAARPGADGKMTFLQHRDVKPQNLMLVGGTVKLADFGLIKVLKHTLTNASSKMTLAYAPPELFGEKLTRWSDQYSLAVSYCLLRGGRMPFNGNAAQLTIGHLQRPPDLSMLPEAERPTVARALEKEPEKRWPNCTVFAESLATVQRPPSKSDVAPPPPLPDPPALPTWVPAAGEETKHPERHGTDDRPPIDDTLSTMHRPLPPAKKPPRAKRAERRSIPWEVWLGVGGIVLVIAVLLAAPSILRSWRGNTPSTEMARKTDPPPRIDPKKDKEPPVTPKPDAPLGMKFVKLPKGTFYMGWDGPDKPGKWTEIKDDFEIAVHTVTQGQWEAIMGNNPSYFSRKGDGHEKVKDIKDEDLAWFPVERVAWEDKDNPQYSVQEFIRKLNAKERGSGYLYRLPTEAEWEYACRGGATSEEECSHHFYFDKPTDDLSAGQANFDGRYPFGKGVKSDSYLGRPVPVDSNQYKPNKLGLTHMHGNVWQWCQDEEGSRRVYRGGSWVAHPQDCRAADRDGDTPSYRDDSLGFRLARVPSGK